MENALPDYPRGLTFEQVWAGLQETRKLIEKNSEESTRRHAETERIIEKNSEESTRRHAETERIIEKNSEESTRRHAETERIIEKNSEESARRHAETERIIEKNSEESALGYAKIERIERIIEENALRQAEINQQMKETDRQMKATDKRVGELTGRFGEVVEHMIVPNLVAKFRELQFEFTKVSRDVKIADREHDIYTEIDAFLENGDKVMIVETKSKPSIDDVNEHIERMGKLRKYADLKSDSRKYLGAIAGVVFNDSEKTYALKNGFYVVEPSGDTFNITKPEGKYRPREW